MSGRVQFGHARRADFRLAADVDHLNHGGYGATPSVVLNAANARRQMEADPTTFFRCELKNRLRQSADCVASSFGGQGKDWAFVENAAAGLNAVIASLDVSGGDELLCLSQVYGVIGNGLRYCARRFARIVTVPFPYI